MSSPEHTNYQEESEINSNILTGKNVLNRYYRIAAVNIVLTGLSKVNFEPGDLSHPQLFSVTGLFGLTASVIGIVDIKLKIQAMNKLKALNAQEVRFYRSLSRHKPDVNHLS